MNRALITTACLTVAVCLSLTEPVRAADWKFDLNRAQVKESIGSGQAPADAGTAVGGPIKKNVGKGVLLSLLIPGTGQLYSGSWVRALPWFAIEAVSWAMFAKYHGEGQDKTDQFEAFAGPQKAPNNFVYDAYMLREYQVAASYASNPYGPGLTQWKQEPWDVRDSHLPSETFTHDINTDDVQQYFEMIGKYYSQFGFGWRDTYPGSANLNDDDAGAIWSDSSQGFFDDESTLEFDGQSPLFYEYRDMRGEANDLLDKGNIAMEIVLVNHVVSALDAAFAVRRFNKHLENSPLGDMQLRYDIRSRDGDIYRGLAAAIPLGK